jgi:hypothetical protein
MSPIRETMANISISAFGFAKAGGEKYFIATAKTAYTTYPSAVFTEPVSKTIYWLYYDQNSRLIWTPISSALAVGTSYSTNQPGYTQGTGSIAADSSGNVWVGNVDPSTGSFSSQITKINSSGTKQWSRQTTFQGSNAYRLILDSSGNTYAVASCLQAPQAGSTQFGLMKYNTSGTQQFRNTYQGSAPNGAYSHAAGRSVQINSAGTALYLAGSINNTGSQMSDTLIKTDSSGVVSWTQTYSSAAGYNPINALDASENSYLLYKNPAALSKFNSSGTWQWGRSFNQTPADVCTDSTGNVYGLFEDGTTTMYLAKWDSSGTIQWQRSITRTSGGLRPIGWSGGQWTNGFHATASSLVFTAKDNNSAVLFKLPLDGSITGSFTVDGLTYTIASSSVTETSSGNFFSSITTLATNSGADSAGNGTTASSSPTITSKVIP